MIMEKINVLITGIGGVGGQIVKALKMAKTEYCIIGTDIVNLNLEGTNLEYRYLVPKADDPSYIDSLLQIIEKVNVKVIIPGTEKELRVIGDNRRIFQELNIYLPINDQKIINLCLNKYKTNEILKNNGFNTPRSIIIESEKDLLKINIFPLVIKPNIDSSGSTNVFIAQDENDLIYLGKYLLSIYSSLLVQEYIGSADEEYTVGVLFNKYGEIVNSIAIKRIILNGIGNRIKVRNRTGNNSLGDYLAISTGITQGKIGRYPNIVKECENIARMLGCKSTVNIQCRFYNSEVYVFEINPRFSGSTSLRAMAGYNEADLLIRENIFNEPINRYFSYKDITIIRYIEEKITKEKIL